MSVPKDKLNPSTSSDSNTTPLLFSEKIYFSEKIHLLDIESLTKLTQQNRIDAMQELGDRYQHGLGGVEKDNKIAAEWFMAAAKQGDEYSQAICLQYGYDGQKDCKAAFHLYKRITCKEMNAKAEFALGLMYYVGDIEMEKSQIKAFGWFQKAAKQGYAPAQYYLGLCYEMGVIDEESRLVHKSDKAKATELYEKAHEQKYFPAKYKLVDEACKKAGLFVDEPTKSSRVCSIT